MPQLDSDSFTYSDGALATVSSGKWAADSNLGDLDVSSGAVRSFTTNRAARIASWTGSTADHYAQCTLVTPDTNYGAGPIIRSDGAGTFYQVGINAINGSTSALYRWAAGTQIELQQFSMTVANGDTIYLEAQGTTLVVKQNGTVRTTLAGEATIASGRPGLSGYTNWSLDNWAAGDFGGAAVLVVPIRFQRRRRQKERTVRA